MTSRHYWTAGATGAAAAFVLCGYECVRSSSNTLYKAAYGAEKLPVVMALMPVGVLMILYLYGRMLSSLGPRRTLVWTTILSSLAIAVIRMFRELIRGRSSRGVKNKLTKGVITST